MFLFFSFILLSIEKRSNAVRYGGASNGRLLRSYVKFAVLRLINSTLFLLFIEAFFRVFIYTFSP